MSHAIVGSDPKRSPVIESAGGNGRCESFQLPAAPLLVDAKATIGRQKISFEPATIVDGLLGLIAIDVSLCGVSSLLTSTFAPSEKSWPGCEHVKGVALLKIH